MRATPFTIVAFLLFVRDAECFLTGSLKYGAVLVPPARTSTLYHSSPPQNNDDSAPVVPFSALMALSGAALGPFLDSYHSAFGVLEYDAPVTAALWSRPEQAPALITSWWVPSLFGLAGLIIGWLYVLLDGVVPQSGKQDAKNPSVPKVLVGISLFTFQYWLSGVLFYLGVDRTSILSVMLGLAAVCFLALDNTVAGLITSAATAIGGPLIEVALLSLSREGGMGESGYHYNDLGETGFFPLWIVPVYFLVRFAL